MAVAAGNPCSQIERGNLYLHRAERNAGGRGQHKCSAPAGGPVWVIFDRRVRSSLKAAHPLIASALNRWQLQNEWAMNGPYVRGVNSHSSWKLQRTRLLPALAKHRPCDAQSFLVSLQLALHLLLLREPVFASPVL